MEEEGTKQEMEIDEGGEYQTEEENVGESISRVGSEFTSREGSETRKSSRRSKKPDGTETETKVEDLAELQFLRKKKQGSRVRRVDMKKYYPDESMSSLEGVIALDGKDGEADDLAIAVREVEHSDEKIDPTKDFTHVDPSFLEEFESSAEEVIMRAREVKEEEGGIVEEVEEESDFQDIYVKPPQREDSDQIYAQICEKETVASTDESFSVPKFKYVHRRKTCPPREEALYRDKGWLDDEQSEETYEIPSNTVKYLNDYVLPALKKTLIEMATYQPSRVGHYLTYSLMHKTKTDEELGLDPKPQLIQALVDGLKKKRKSFAVPKKPEVFKKEPIGESQVSFPITPVKSEISVPPVVVPRSPSISEDTFIHQIQKKYKKAKEKMITEEKDKRKDIDFKAMAPGPCLGPTSLPYVEPVQPPEPPKSPESSDHQLLFDI